MLFQKEKYLGHLLHIVDFRPSLISCVLALGKFCLDIDEHIHLLFRLRILLQDLRVTLHLAGDDLLKVVRSVSFPEGLKTDKPLLVFSLDGWIWTSLYQILFLFQEAKQLFKIFRISRDCYEEARKK